jgi:hypothetical protein
MNTYPDKPLSPRDMAKIIGAAVRHTEWINMRVPDNKEDIISDISAIGYPELANLVRKLLSEKINDHPQSL